MGQTRMSTPEVKEGTSSLRDAIITLPQRTFVGLGLATLCAIGGAMAVAALATDNGVRGPAASAVVVMLPVLIALIAAGGLRRTSTRQIDALVDGFLHETLLERFKLWCDTGGSAQPPYVFSRVEKLTRAEGRSYAGFRFRWRAASHPPVEVVVKMNVFNIELLATLPMSAEGVSAGQFERIITVNDRAGLNALHDDKLLKHIFGTLQGSIEEGYAVRVWFSPCEGDASSDTAPRVMRVSLRQKLSASFLTSPFLKRYFAEDVAIATGCLYHEWLESPLAPRKTAKPEPVAETGPTPSTAPAAGLKAA